MDWDNKALSEARRHILGDDTARQSNAKCVRSSFLWYEDGGRFRGVDSGLSVAVGIFVGLALLFGIISSWLIQYNAVPTYFVLVRRHVDDELVCSEVKCNSSKGYSDVQVRTVCGSIPLARSTCLYIYMYMYLQETLQRRHVLEAFESWDKASLEAY